jgi:hypothetical protein
MYAYLGKYAYIWKSTNIYEYICIWTCIWIYIYIQIHLRCVLANYQLLFLLPKHEGAGLEVQLPRPNCPLLLQTLAHSVPSIISVMEYNLPVDTSPTTPPHNASLARTCSHNPSGLHFTKTACATPMCDTDLFFSTFWDIHPVTRVERDKHKGQIRLYKNMSNIVHFCLWSGASSCLSDACQSIVFILPTLAAGSSVSKLTSNSTDYPTIEISYSWRPSVNLYKIPMSWCYFQTITLPTITLL